jgi:hypothetical protein
MKSIHILQTFLLVLPWANGAPTAQPSNPPLRGSEDLLGYSSSNTITEQSTEVKYTPVAGQKDDANNGVYLDFEGVDNPQPIRGDLGGTDPGPSMLSFVLHARIVGVADSAGNTYYDQINSDKLAPPGTDHGQTINAQWPMGMSSYMALDHANLSQDSVTTGRFVPLGLKEIAYEVDLATMGLDGPDRRIPTSCRMQQPWQVST